MNFWKQKGTFPSYHKSSNKPMGSYFAKKSVGMESYSRRAYSREEGFFGSSQNITRNNFLLLLDSGQDALKQQIY